VSYHHITYQIKHITDGQLLHARSIQVLSSQ
jgi:hypothetical protein